MKKQVLFIQGGGNEGYESDKALADSLIWRKYAAWLLQHCVLVPCN